MSPQPGIEEILATTSICVCVGSGGVGKTTTSAAIAAGMAARGKRVAVLTIDPAKRLADSLGLDDLANAETRVDPSLFSAAGADPGAGELWATMLDSKATFDDMVTRYAPDPEAEARILDNRIYREISGALAGSQEFMAMERLYEIHERGDYDLIVLDTPPSRNALDFLDAPQRLVQFIEGRSLRLFMRPAGLGARIAGGGASVVFSGLRRLTGLDLLNDLSEFFAATGGMLGGFRERAERVNGLLADERTRFVVVCGPTSDAVEEGVFLREKLREGDLPLGGLVVNRVHGAEASADPAEAEAELRDVVAEAGLRERVLAAYRDAAALADRDERSVASLRRRIGDAPMLLVPEMPKEVNDLAGLLGLGSYLFAEPAAES